MARFQAYLYNPEDPQLTEKVQRDIPEFNFPFPQMDELIRYTIYVYDPHADLIKLFPGDFSRRKAEAAKRAGFAINEDGKFDRIVEDCMVGANDSYNDALVAFVTRFNIADLPSYVMYRDVFFSEMKAALAADRDSTDKKTASALRKEAMGNAEIARNRLNELEVRLFTDTETMEVRSALYILAEKMKLNLRPEHIATAIERRELNLPDPYYPGSSHIEPQQKRRGRPKKS